MTDPLADAAAFWRLFHADRGALYLAVGAKYRDMPLSYVMYFLDCFADLEGDPQALTYLDADLGAGGRMAALLDGLAPVLPLLGARVLDIGCSNGALLRAAALRGAARCLGLDVDPRRLISARKVCTGLPIEVREHDAGAAPLSGPYDAIFCIDVLEHVADWRRLVAHALAALAPGGAVFLSWHNAEHPASVLSEPHYGIPGLSVMDPVRAAAWWARCRGALGRSTAYEVHTWPRYREVEAVAVTAGCTVTPWAAVPPDPFWTEADTWLDRLTADVAGATAALAVAPAEATELRDAVADYTRDAQLAHEAARTAGALGWLEHVSLWMTYYAQPINMLVQRPA